MSDVQITNDVQSRPVSLYAETGQNHVTFEVHCVPRQVQISIRPLNTNIIFLPGSNMPGIEIFSDTVKVDASSVGKIVTITEGAIAVNAYATTNHALQYRHGDNPLRQLEVGEEVSNEQVITPHKVPFWSEIQINFPIGSKGSVSYSALSSDVEITVTDEP